MKENVFSLMLTVLDTLMMSANNVAQVSILTISGDVFHYQLVALQPNTMENVMNA